MATPVAANTNYRKSLVEEAVQEVVYVQDCRSKGGRQIRINRHNVSTCEKLVSHIRNDLKIDRSESFVVTTTNREVIDTSEKWACIEDGETLYVLEDVTQDLPVQTQERVTFLPHYDTIVKGGMYEYYASEGHNPLPFAFAELIDNALAATADNKGSRDIEIRLVLDDAEHRNSIIVIDNGRGMTPRQLNNWAVYRLSKFTRRDSHGIQSLLDNDNVPVSPQTPTAAPRSLNSDISYFGVGGKQAVFFIGTAARMISRPRGSKDVHELLISKEEFEQREKNREAIYSGFICNRKPGDNSHINSEQEVLSSVIAEESKRESFTAVVIDGINLEHVKYLRTNFDQWTKRLAHIYHYYLHGPRGNFDRNDLDRKSAANQIEEYTSWINIQVTMMSSRSKSQTSINLRDIDDDIQTQYIRSAASTFEFKATVATTGIVEGILRYHPFLYDHETYPTDDFAKSTTDDDDQESSSVVETRPARGKRPIFECYWNGRLIPYSSIDEFDWCSVPKKNRVLPAECYNRISGVLWTNDKFQVSTNKLTFIDLEMRLRDKDTTYTRVVTKESKKIGRRVMAEVLEKRTDIGREFVNWLKECHEQCDKQIKFSRFLGSIVRPELPRSRQAPWSVFEQVDWDNKTYTKGSLVRVARVQPIAYGSVQRFLLYGEYDGDVYATGGEVEIRLEPRSLIDDVKIFTLAKVDRSVTLQQIKKAIDDEEGRLPDRLVVTFPDGDEVKEGDELRAGATIGNIQIEISNRRGELISKLPGSQQKKLLIELKLIYHVSGEDHVVAQYICQHGKTWPYWFRKMENIRAVGSYKLLLQTVLNESGGATTVAGKQLPTYAVSFTVTEAEAEKFTIGFLEGPFRIGVPFQIPLEFHDSFGLLTKPDASIKPEVEASGLDISYSCTEFKGSALIIKDIVANGSVTNILGKNFNLVVKVAGLKEDSTTLKIRMLPGVPHTINVTPDSEQAVENGQEVIYTIDVVDVSGNPTSATKLAIMCSFSLIELQTITVSCPGTTIQLHVPVCLKSLKGSTSFKAKIEVAGVRGVPSVERVITVTPSSSPATIEVFYYDSEGQPVQIKANQDVIGVCGNSLSKIAFVLKDEAGRRVTIDDNIAAMLKVNWTPKISKEVILEGHLPGIKLPQNVAESKYCQISLAGIPDFSFTVKGLPGEPHQIKCSVMGSNKIRMGEKMEGDIQVDVRDKYGNEIKKFEKGVLSDLLISSEGMLVLETVRMLGKASGFNISGIKFQPGPLGVRDISVSFRGIVDHVRVEIVAGVPTKLDFPGWDVSRLISVFNGCMLPRELIVRLCDSAGNLVAEPNVRIQLFKDAGLKLTPAPQVLKTDKEGQANFGVFAVSGKCGTYEMQLKAFLGRNVVIGTPMVISVQPDATKPASFVMQYVLDEKYVVGDVLPDFVVSVLAENEAPLACAKPSFIQMKIWKVQNAEGSAHATTTCSLYQPDDGDQSSNCESGVFKFTNRKVPESAGTHNVVFIYNDGKHELVSNSLKLVVCSGPAVALVPLQDPGTPTVSNATNAASRVLIRNLQFELRDQYGNTAGLELVGGKVHVEIVKADGEGEVPVLIGNTSRLQINLVKGRAIVQNLMIQENCPGKDGKEYKLKFTVDIPSVQQLSIPPYELSFLFYNDQKKQSQMALLSKERDSLAAAVRTYKSLFDISEQLISELRSSFNESKKEEQTFKTELFKMKFTESELSLANLDRTIQSKIWLKQQISQRHRRICGLHPADPDPEVLGKVGHLAEVADTDIAVVLSWHMSADMDCIITTTTKKAQELYQLSNGRQQVLPLDSIYRKSIPEWDKPLPHFRSRPHWKPPGNPEYARNTLSFPKEEASCRIVFGMLLGDTLLLDTLDDATSYRQELVKFAQCPTILTRTGDRVRSNGKFGGLMNRALPLDKLRGAVFGEPISPEYSMVVSQIEMLHNYQAAVVKRREAEQDLNLQIKNQTTPEMKKKRQECNKAEEELKQVERKLGVSSSSRASWPGSNSLNENCVLSPPAPTRNLRRSAADVISTASASPSKRTRRN